MSKNFETTNLSFERTYSQSKNAFLILAIVCLTERFASVWALNILKRLPIIGGYYLVIYYAVLLFLLIVAWKYIQNRYRGVEICALGLFIIAYCISYFNIDNTEYLNKGIYLCCVQAIPLFYFGLGFDLEDDIKILFWKRKGYDWMYILSLIGVGMNLVYYLYFISSGREIYENSSASTNTLIPLCYLIFIAIRKRKLLAIAASIAGFLAMIAYGVRTNMLAAVVMVIIMLIFELKASRYKVVIISFISAAGAILYVNFNAMILYLEVLFAEMGINNRFFYLFHSEGLGYLSGRESVWDIAIAKIQEHPFIGYGIFGDRAFYGDMNGYSHNLFLEVIVDYGSIVGGTLIVLLVVVLFRGFCATRASINENGFFFSLACSELIMLMSAGSYLVEGPFFFLLGFAIHCYRKR